MNPETAIATSDLWGREREVEDWWDHEVSRLLHEYEVHDVPHREITGRDNYFMSISEVSRFTNPEFTRHIKAIVKGRARYRCECCGRSWTDVTHPDDETLYFRTLEKLWNLQLIPSDFRLSDLGRDTFTEYVVAVGLDRCKNCGAVLQIATRWWTGEPKRIRPSQWFQVHHKNFQHFDNQLENLEYLCGNCHGHKGQVVGKNKTENSWHLGEEYVQGLIEYLQSRGISLSYMFLSKEGRFSWAVIGGLQD
jgi:hypothetical protein